MKYISKFSSIVLIISLITTLFSGNVYAEKPVSDINNTVILEESNTDYIEYVEKGEDYNGASIKIDASGFSAEKGSTAKKASYNEKDNIVLIYSDSGFVSWTINCEKAGLYQISFDYCAVDDTENKIELSCAVNGEVPYEAAQSMFLPRVWVNEGKPNVDALNNESSPRQIQKPEWITEYLVDADGLFLEPLKFNLKEGKNTFSIKLYTGTIALSAINLSGAVETPKYNAADVDNIYEGKDIIIQGQDAIEKNSKELRPLSDKTDPSVTPSNAYCTKLNNIGGSNWDSAGEKITWKVKVDKSAYYAINFRYKQGYLTNASSIRSLKIDGETPFAECKDIAFPYTTEWSMLTLGGNKPYYVYLEKGEHTLSLEVSLGKIADISRKLEDLIFDVGKMYRQIIMITGTTPDANRDYRLYDQIPTLTDELKKYVKTIDSLVKEYNGLTGAKGGSNAVTLEQLALVFERMLESKFESHKYVGDLFNNYSSAGAWIYEMRKMPLDIEKIILSGKKVENNDYSAGFFEKLIFGFKKLIASYIIDYNVLSAGETNNSIEVWVNIGRDQSRVLQRMAEDTFTPQSKVNVNIKIASASMIQAKLSGNAPDCTILQVQETPINLAMRGALYDISKFPDFKETVVANYGDEDPIEPFIYKDGVYGLPDSITYMLMYVRDDVFEQLDVEVPKTWDEFLRVCAVLMRNNLSVGVPTLNALGAATPIMHATFLYQHGGTLYTDDLRKTNLTTEESFKAFDFFTDLYAKYKLPVNFSLYNRFRTGEMPLGIDSYSTYATLMAAAPEISGCWSIHPLPGTPDENGNINNTIVGTSTAAVILEDTDNPEGAWEFLKWWTSADTQLRYSSDIESIVGIAARYAASNINALKQLSWNREDAEIIVGQYEKAIFLPEVPGSYYVTRSLENAFYNVYNDGDDTKEALTHWSLMIDEEMARKAKEYSFY